MIVTLEGTTSAQISSALLRARRSVGSPAMGMVLTLIIVCDEADYPAALKTSLAAGREHPSRVLLVVQGSGRRPTLDAEVRIGEGTADEVVVIRMHGVLARHPASVIRPLLLPDSPVVIWWPGPGPTDPVGDELAHLAGRRITDAASSRRPTHNLHVRAETYQPGDTDLAWTRITPWRALLAAALDQYPARITHATVEAERSNPSADLLAAWLASRLHVEVTQKRTAGPGLTAVRLTTAAGDIAITRPDGLLASYSVPGQPNRLVALKRRGVAELVSEELRRMDRDDIFEATLHALVKRTSATPRKVGSRVPEAAELQPTGTTPSRSRSSARTRVTAGTLAQKSAARKAPANKTAANKTAAKKTAAKKTAKA
ncbi:MAG: glucose-6-phosphate dehydrogenase assembly protein OpcA [Propionibacteriaceae bacterium]